MKPFVFLLLFFPLESFCQMSLHTEARFRGMSRCPSLVVWGHAQHWEIWTRSEIYPEEAVNNEQFPSIRKQLGNTTLFGIGFSEIKVVAGFQNGEFIKGLHMNSESDDGRFWYNVFLIHKPPLGQNEFRLDGEIDLQAFSDPLKSFTNRRTRTTVENSMGAMVRLECYEPVPLVIHSGVAFRKLLDKGKSNSTSPRPSGSDFNRRMDGKRTSSDGRNSSTSVFTVICGPSYYFSRDWGANVVLKWTL